MTHRSPPLASVAAATETRSDMATVLRRREGLTVPQINSFILTMKRYPCIWNSNHPDYVHRNTVAIAWAEIAKRLQLSEDSLRAKWKNLRDVFMKEWKRATVTSPEDYRGKWRHFKQMWFLHQIREQPSEDEGSEASEQNRESIDMKIEHSAEEEIEFLDTEHEVAISPKPDKNSRSDDGFDVQSPRLRINQDYSDEDSDKMFLMSLAPYLKLLKPVRKLVVRNKIQDIILKEMERSTANGRYSEC